MATTVFNVFDPTGLQAGNLQPVHRGITLASGAVLPRGAVLGLVTASGKAILSATAATDGSQTPKCILAVDTDASAGDTVTAAYFIGEFAAEKLTYGAGHTSTTVDAALIASGAQLYIRKTGLVA